MTVPEQPRDDAGRFAPYRRPPVPPALRRPNRRPLVLPPALEQPVPYVSRPIAPGVPESVASVCCPECVYGVQA